MKIAIMQPYIFPYLGYYQLVGAVDQFVFFDDVNFMKKSWINRNQLLQHDKPLRFTIPLINASQNRLINEIELSEFSIWRKAFLKTIELNYKKAPHFGPIFKWMSEFFFLKEYSHIGTIAIASIKAVAVLLGLNVKFLNSSEIIYRNTTMQKGPEKVIEICKILKAENYINPKNGTALYDSKEFEVENIKLNFIAMNSIVYNQFKPDEFVPNLSIIDVLMFNTPEQIRYMLSHYQLV